MSGGADPVTAIAEADATGETAAIFADIRAVMGLPLITSIWRTLVGIDGGLPAVWAAAKPVYQTGQPAAALARLSRRASLPLPPPMAPGALAVAGVRADDLPVILGLIDAYNRSNGMNMIALTALVADPAGSPPDGPPPGPPPAWPPVPTLLSRAEIAADVWTLLERVNRYEAGDLGLATLWRHLAHWPGLLSLIDDGYTPLADDGTVKRAMQQVFDISNADGARLAHLRPDTGAIPPPAADMVRDYVARPEKVARMVTMGHGVAQWLRRSISISS